MKKALTLLMAVMVGLTASAQYKAPKIIAHRGFHKAEGAARNSLKWMMNENFIPLMRSMSPQKLLLTLWVKNGRVIHGLNQWWE